MSEFLQWQILPNRFHGYSELINRGQESQLVGRNAGKKIARDFVIEGKMLGVEFKAVSPVFGVG